MKQESTPEIDDKEIVNLFEDEYDDDEFDVDLDLDLDLKYNLPYEREYDVLSPEELLDLINEAKFKKWNKLDLSMCGLRALPPEIGTLTDLEILDLGNDAPINENDISRNIFITLPPEIVKLKNLRTINLYGTKLRYFPKEFSSLTNLQNINLNGTNLDFPEELCCITSLRKLAIDSLSYLPENISNLKELLKLYLPDSLITRLPESIGNLKELRVLYLGRSNIEKIPVSLSNLKNLKRLELDDSPITKNIPPEILSQTPAQVIDYILRFQNDDNKLILNESKMVIVGQGGVGKTSLLNRIINDKYIEGTSTEGIDIAHWHFASEGIDYKLNAWDFGGQEIYHSTHQFFLTKRSLYIFVWDARQEEEYGRIDYWLNTIQSFANDCSIIIVVNKCDENRKNIKHIDINDLMVRFPQVIGSYNVSCIDNTNIESLRREIINQAKNLPLMKTVWFSSWVSVRNKLEQLSKVKNLINYNDYIDICSANSIGSEEALSLIKYLHDLGVVLHFNEDVLLRNIIILSPEWGTDAVYKILDAQSNILKDRNGIVHYEDLPKIWSDKLIYPNHVYPYILKLMENFQLSFTVESNETFLVAELLDNSEKDMQLEFPSSSTLNFRYDYNFLPAGIMTRFIVKAHTLLIDDSGVKMCWRKGAFLQYNDAYGLVRLRDGITDRYVEIKVSGKNGRNRRELLAIVRNTFEQIHKSIPKIDFIEKVLCNCSPSCSYLHDFKYLNRLEIKGINEERCKDSLEIIEVIMLLDGIQITQERKSKMTEININPVFSPIITTNANASNVNTITNAVTIEIRNSINELQGSINELKDELGDVDQAIATDFEKVSSSLQKLDEAQTKDEIIKSGALNKIRRFLEEVGEPETSTAKLLNGIKHGHSILQDIAGKYNSIAEWCGMPVVPKVLLIKNT